MNDELAEIKISNLEQRIDRLVQELAQGKHGDNVQNAQLQPFVPIPRITGEDQKPFDIETDDDDAKSVVRCIFYWGKEQVELADYSLDEIPATGNATLYLTRTISEGEQVYALTTDEPEEGDENTAYYKIYDFTDGEVSCDYRATFLTLGISSKFVGDMEGSEVIDAANDQILVTGHPGEEDSQGQDSHSGILFLTVSARKGQGGEKIPAKIIARIKDKKEDENWGAKTMTVPISGGGTKIVHFLGCDDVDLTKIASGIQSVTLNGKEGIRVTQVIAAGAYTGNILNTGVIGLVGQDSSQAANGTITTKGANGSGLKVTVTRSAEPTEQAPLSNGTLEVDIDGRGEGDSFGTKELQLEGKKVATIFGTANVNIKQKKIAAGTGVEVAEANGVVTISATGAATSGFTGSRTVLADTQYSGHYLQKRFYTETWKDGVLESSTLGNWITYHTAVEETA